ncbi:Smr domain-containing protein [Mycena kentingensis (nom. inval.)]|nr:Smr domain-containing protein [Mycena kentingensis (nom. inval.)]
MDYNTIFDSLQREFCPPLDTSLLAALLADIDLDVPSTSTHIAQLRKNLLLLAEQADFEDLSCSDDSAVPDFCTSTTTTTTTTTSELSTSFNSPLGFLIATMPHIPIERLRQALEAAEVVGDADEIDMWEVIATLLSEETERDMRERDLDEGEIRAAEKTAWETVEPKKTGRKGKKPAKKITLSDVRQQQHVRPAPAQRPAQIDDPWAQLTSISTHIAQLLPPHEPKYFQSYFHSPEHASTPYNALCAALAAITPPNADDTHRALYHLLDVLLPSYEELDEDGRTRLFADIELALGAAHGRGEDAFEIVKVLRDLDTDATEGRFEIGVFHTQAPSKSLPEGPAPTPPPPPKLARAATVPAASPSGSKPSPDAAYTHAMHIPTDVNGRRVGGIVNGKPVSASSPADYHRRVGDAVRKRDELLREAARMWQRGRGNKKGRGGEVAMYFAERAKEYSEIARREALDGAREMVLARRRNTNGDDAVDLHGVTAVEAITIVNEILADRVWAPEKPLRIITGRGSHSVGQVSVLKPAVRKALEEQGWIVGEWDGGLTVRGKRFGLR